MKKVTNTSESPRPDWLFGQNPNAIENQEKQGQEELVNSDQLPAKIGRLNYEQVVEEYAKIGIKVIGKTKGDDLFLDVVLPNGWKKKQTDHSMWNDLVDDKNAKRAQFFYKAAFYDRDAFIRFNPRYSIERDWEKETTNFHVLDNQTGLKIFESTIFKDYMESQQVIEEANNFLNTNFPEYQNPHAYWD